MMVWSLFIIDLMGLFFYNKNGSIIFIGDLPTTNIIEPHFLACLQLCIGNGNILTNFRSDTNLFFGMSL